MKWVESNWHFNRTKKLDIRFNKVVTNKALNASLAQKIWDFANISVLFDIAQPELFFLSLRHNFC